MNVVRASFLAIRLSLYAVTQECGLHFLTLVDTTPLAHGVSVDSRDPSTSVHSVLQVEVVYQ